MECCCEFLSSVGDAGASCKSWIHRMLTTPDSSVTISHVEVLIQALKLEVVKVKILSSQKKSQRKDTFKNNATALALTQLGSVIVLNNSGGSNKKRKSWIQKPASKEVSLFNFKFRGKPNKIKASKLLAYALDCHEVVEELQRMHDEMIASAHERLAEEVPEHEKLFLAGTCLNGEISIPPQEPEEEIEDESDEDHPVYRYRNINHDPTFTDERQDRARPYQLTILREIVDETGKNIWIGRHQTFDGRRDKQTVLMNFMNSETQTGFLHFEDFETHCDGEVSDDKNRIHGRVKQLQKGRPGFFVPSKGVEHNFFLERSHESNCLEVNKVLSKLLLARYARALAFSAWCGVAVGDTVEDQYFEGCDVIWTDIIEDMVWICDEVGTLMRRYVTLLDALSFGNKAERTRTLGALADKGISRGRVHVVWDAATVLLPLLRNNIPYGSTHSGNDLRAASNFADQVTGRLQSLYNRFDQALRRVDKRVCEDYKAEWRKNFREELTLALDSRSMASSNQGHDPRFDDLLPVSRRGKKAAKQEEAESVEDEVICTICTTTFEKNEPMYLTPCKHAFHVDCLENWFKEDSVCPICRQDFSQVDS